MIIYHDVFVYYPTFKVKTRTPWTQPAGASCGLLTTYMAMALMLGTDPCYILPKEHIHKLTAGQRTSTHQLQQKDVALITAWMCYTFGTEISGTNLSDKTDQHSYPQQFIHHCEPQADAAGRADPEPDEHTSLIGVPPPTHWCHCC